MNFVINNFLYLKLFLWWNFIIKKNEFHPNYTKCIIKEKKCM